MRTAITHNDNQHTEAAPRQAASHHFEGTPTKQFADLRPEFIAQGNIQRMADNSERNAIQRKTMEVAQRNNTGMPNNIKAGLESISGQDLSDVKVHRNSSEPAKIGAHAYTQGSNIYVSPGQDKHIAHEGWHAVQQKQNRVQPTGSVGGKPLNDSPSLEREADVMGAKAESVGNSMA